MLYRNTLAPETLDLLQDLAKEPVLGSMRLIGGTALALQLGHRTSVDLDFSGPALCGGADELRAQFAKYKSLVYFEDAEEEPMPNMLVGMGWGEIRSTVESAVRAVVDS